jgi:hypothetical protein
MARYITVRLTPREADTLWRVVSLMILSGDLLAEILPHGLDRDAVRRATRKLRAALDEDNSPNVTDTQTQP